MKRSILLVITTLTLLSCSSPVIRGDYMEKATVNVPAAALKANPKAYKGRLFVFGGVIVSTKLTERGSLIEGVYLPVDSQGVPGMKRAKDGRFLAFYPGELGLLDPVLYSRQREVTIAGEFREMQRGKIDEMDYDYPLFEIKDIHLWEERSYLIAPPTYPSWYYPYPYWWYDPWWRGYGPRW